MLILAVLVVVVIMGSYVWREILWYQSVDYTRVLVTEYGVQSALFVVGALVCGLVVASSMVLAYRHRPFFAPTSVSQQALDHYRAIIEPLRRVALVAGPGLLAVFAGVAASSQWRNLLLFLNRQSFGKSDPTFDLDVGFFVFTLPWLSFLESFATMVLVLAIIAAAFTHYVYGGLQFGAKGVRTTRAARIHLSLLGAVFVLLRAVGYWLDRYELSVKDSQRITGLTYTDATAVMPTKAILAIAAVICAGLFVATIWTRSWRLPIVGVSLLLVTSVLIGGLFPAAVQSLRVRPNEQSLEAPYIEANIVATREAYGLDRIKTQQYQAKTTADQGQLRKDAETIPGIRILDPLIVSPTFQQMQGLRQYYEFPDALDVDRYVVNGTTQDTVIAARELNVDGIPQRNWVNDHTVYTHGFGVVAAYGNRRTSDGEPLFFIKDIPPSGAITSFEPRIYFGENTRTYSIVGAPEGQAPREIDYQTSDSGEARYTYTGSGGVAMDNFLKRTAYAIGYGEAKILLSEQVSDASRMLDYRTPRERVERVAPWLTLDGNAYPAIVEGRVEWILDGYTTTANYPYSKLQSLDSATADAVTTRARSVSEVAAGQVNYIRNSVKATVDAYDGSVKLYAWDDQDPLLKAWSQAFGGTVRPLSEISGALMSHLRYPEDLFKVQRELLTRYHVTDAGSFYSGGDYWKTPEDPTGQAQRGSGQPPYYLSIKMPDQAQPAFSLTTSFSPIGDNRPFLAGFLAVDSDAGSVDGKRRDGYGTMRLLNLPASTNVPGPAQVQNQINTSNQNSKNFALTLSQFLGGQGQSGTQVIRGNLLTLPVGDGLLYVQPIYQRSTSGTTYPFARAVVVAFGNNLAWANTLDEALDQLFGGSSGATAGDSGTGGTTDPTTPTTPTTPTDKAAQLKAALAEVQKQYDAGQTALKAGDWTAYGNAQKALQAAIQRAITLQPTGTTTVTPSATSSGAPPSNSPTASPSPTSTNG